MWPADTLTTGPTFACNNRDVEQIFIRQANALDIAQIANRMEKDVREISPDNLQPALAAIENTIVHGGPSTFWVATSNSTIVGAAKVSALGPGHAALIALDWINADSDQAAAKIVSFALGDLTAQAWAFTTAQEEFLIELGFEATETIFEAGDTSPYVGVGKLMIR